MFSHGRCLLFFFFKQKWEYDLLLKYWRDMSTNHSYGTFPEFLSLFLQLYVAKFDFSIFNAQAI